MGKLAIGVLRNGESGLFAGEEGGPRTVAFRHHDSVSERKRLSKREGHLLKQLRMSSGAKLRESHDYYQ